MKLTMKNIMLMSQQPNVNSFKRKKQSMEIQHKKEIKKKK